MTIRRGRAPYRPDAQELATQTMLDWKPTHRELEQIVIRIALGNGWLVHEIHDSRGEHWGASSGWPDVFLVRGNQAIALELKIPPDDLTDEQRAWLAALDAVPGIMARKLMPSGRGYTADLVAIAGLLR